MSNIYLQHTKPKIILGLYYFFKQVIRTFRRVENSIFK